LEAAPQPAPTPPRSRLLIVDDEPGIQQSARRILSRRYDVRIAESGMQALEMMAAEPHDLAIVDVRMPGMNGFEVLKAIKAAHPETEVIIMTGSISNPEEKLVEAIRERAFYFINKPFEKAVLEVLVERCLERQRLERENRAYTRTLEDDLDKAQRFQKLLLPRAFPPMPGLRGAVRYVPSERLSGDFYDFYPLGPTRLGVLIADVAGHGISAALYTGMLKSEMQWVFQDWEHPGVLFDRINERLQSLVRDRYITAILSIFDLAARRMRYVNAGHPGFLGADGRSWESTGTPLGMLPDPRYETRELAIVPGDRWLFFSDGLSEAMAADGRDFGVERIRESFQRSQRQAPAAALDALLADAHSFTGMDGFDDDATVLMLDFLP
jgi:serine phosphatase RsbU (regulator of sigma subunit)